MFIQVISGKVTDPDEFGRQADAWKRDVRPGAIGFLGSTEGVTEDGRFIVVACFESAEAAAQNSDRPEQGEWWAAFEKSITGAEFKDSTQVVTLLGGGKDNAGFVQVMRGRVTDQAKFKALETELGAMEDVLGGARPDVIGQVIALHDDGTYTDVVYFTSEAEARANETKPMSAEAEAMLEEMMSTVEVDEYLDLKEPSFQ